MMHVRFTRGLTLPTLAAIAVVVVAVGGMFVALLNGFRAFRDDTRDRSRAGLILSHSHAAQRAVIDVETGLRGYLLVSDARFLEPFDAGRRASGARFVALDRAERRLLDIRSACADAHGARVVALAAVGGGLVVLLLVLLAGYLE